MQRIHLLAVQDPVTTFEPLLAAAHEAGIRLGWLRLDEQGLERQGLDPEAQLPAELPEDLRAAADMGVLRAVQAGPGGTVVVKPRRGTPVLRDLLREHFLGCAAVLLSGAVQQDPAIGELRAEGDAWRVRPGGGDERVLSTQEFLRALERPSFWS